MRAVIKDNGNLRILAGNQDRADLADALLTDWKQAQNLVYQDLNESFMLINPVSIGALVDEDLPIFVSIDDYDYDDDNMTEIINENATVWFYNNWAIDCPYRQLANIGYVDFQRN